MSRWPPDRYRLLVAPGRMELGRTGWRGMAGVSVLSADVTGVGDLRDWRPVLGALDAIERDRIPRGSQVDVVLSQHFVRCIEVQPVLGIETAADWQNYAAGRLAEALGRSSDAFVVRLHGGRPGSGALVAGIECDLHAALERWASQRGVRLRSLSPRLAAVSVRFRSVLTGGLLALIEPGRISSVESRGGCWATLGGGSYSGDACEALRRCLDRSEALAHAPPGRTREQRPVRVFVSAESVAALQGDAGRDVQRLPAEVAL